MQIEDKESIKNIVLKYPELMAKDAKETIKKEFYEIKEKQKELSDLRMKANDLEKELKLKEDIFRHQSSLFDIIYNTKDINYTTNNCSLGIINREDARNI